jgi:hypothetical protein
MKVSVDCDFVDANPISSVRAAKSPSICTIILEFIYHITKKIKKK